MKWNKVRRFTAVIITLLLCACGRQLTGLGSQDLQISSITFHDSYPATITGILPAGKPSDFAAAADSPLIQSITMSCFSPEDTSGLSEVNTLISYPLFYSIISETGEPGTALVKIEQKGLTWEPDYILSEENGDRRIYASAALENMTVQTWQADTVRFMSPENIQVTAATGRITIRQGHSHIPWWDAHASEPVHIIRYGWPSPGRWNPLVAVTCPGKGRIVSWTEQVFETADTLYFPADSLLELNLAWEQEERGYDCFLSAESRSDITITWEIEWPETMPRGAGIEPGINIIELNPGQSVTILYKELY